MTDRLFTAAIARRGSQSLAALPAPELDSLERDAQAVADWLQSQAAEMQRLATRCRKARRKRHGGPDAGK